MSIVVLAEHDGAKLSKGTLCAIAAAEEMQGDISLLVLTADSAGSAVVEQATNVAGVKQVLHAAGSHLENPLAENHAQILADVARGEVCAKVVAAASSYGRNVLPRAAALLDVQPISEIISVEGEGLYKRPIYAGNCIATVQSEQALDVITVRATAFDPVGVQGGQASLKSVEVKQDLGISKFLDRKVAASERPDLTSAGVVISGGRGMQSGENFKLLEGIADKLGAAIGASRAAVDSGYAPNDWQVGQTGKIVAPDLYIAVGISGAIQHLAGMKDSKVIVAINKDEEAPIFQIADYGLVADLFSALPELEEKL